MYGFVTAFVCCGQERERERERERENEAIGDFLISLVRVGA